MPALDYLVAGAEHIARSLVPAAVQAVALSTRTADGALGQTFDAYLASGLDVQQTAAALPAHPNTVHAGSGDWPSGPATTCATSNT